MRAPNVASYPKYIAVGPAEIRYKIVFVTGKKWLGMCSLKKRTIWLNKKQPRTHLFMTFLHELIHAIEFESGRKIKHKIVYELEEGLYNFFINNVSSFSFGKARE